MAQNNQILKRFIQQYPEIEGIVLSDKECIEICSIYRDEQSTINEKKISMMYVAALSQSNDNLQKLCHTKTKNITLIYDEYIVYIEIWSNVILSIYCNQEANIGKLKQIANELQQIFGNKYNEAIDKQSQLNR